MKYDAKRKDKFVIPQGKNMIPQKRKDIYQYPDKLRCKTPNKKILVWATAFHSSAKYP